MDRDKIIETLSEKIESIFLDEVKRKEIWLKDHPEKTERDWLIEERAVDEKQKSLLLQLFKVVDEKNLNIEYGTSWWIHDFGKVFSDFRINGVYYDLKMPQIINDTFNPSRHWETANEYIDWKLEQLGFPGDLAYSTRMNCYHNYGWVHDFYRPWTYLVPNQRADLKDIYPEDLDKLIKDFSQEKDASKRIVVWCDMPNYEAQFKNLKIYFDSNERPVLGTLTETAKTLIALSKENSLIAATIAFNQSVKNLFVNDLTKFKVSIVYGSGKDAWIGCTRSARKIEENFNLPSIYWFDIKDREGIEKIIRLHGFEQYLCKDSEKNLGFTEEPSEEKNTEDMISYEELKGIIDDYLDGKKQSKPIAVWSNTEIQDLIEDAVVYKDRKTSTINDRVKRIYIEMFRLPVFGRGIRYSELANELNSSKKKPELLIYIPEWGDSCNEGIIAYGAKVSELTDIPVIFFLHNEEKDILNRDNKDLVEEISCYNFHEGLSPKKENGKWGYINQQGEYMISPQFETAGNFHEGLAAVGLNDKIGYINKEGEFQIKPQFDEAYDFNEGLAGVLLNQKWGFVNKEGELVIPYKFDNVKDFKNGLAWVEIDLEWKTINKKGEFITE